MLTTYTTPLVYLYFRRFPLVVPARLGVRPGGARGAAQPADMSRSTPWRAAATGTFLAMGCVNMKPGLPPC